MKFKDMNIWSKLLFIIGWIGVIGSIMAFLIGLLLALDNNMLGSDFIEELDNISEGITGEELIKAYSVAIIIMAIVGVVSSWFSIKAARDNSKIFPALIFNAIDCIMSVTGIFNDGSFATYISGLIINGISLLACIMISSNNKKTIN